MSEFGHLAIDSPILGIGSVILRGELKPLVLIKDFLFPVFPYEPARWSIAGYDLRSRWRRIAFEDCFISIADVRKHGAQALTELLSSMEPDPNTVVVFISDPELSLFGTCALGVRLGRGGNGTLGIGFELPNGEQQFSTAGHVTGYYMAEWRRMATKTLTLPGVHLIRRRCLGLVKTVQPFGRLIHWPDPTTPGAADIAIIAPFNNTARESVVAVPRPTAELEICTMHGAESGIRSGWKAGAISVGKIADDWPNSWFAISTKLSGFATQGDSGARVHNAAGELLGHVVATAGVRTVGGTTQGAIVQDIVFQRTFAEREFGLPKAASLIAAK
jgi:hypothetical protein